VEQFPFVPTLGDDIFPALPSVVLKTGNYSRIPFIAGTNLDEGTAFVPQPANVGPNTPAQWLSANFTPSLLPNGGEASLQDAVSTLLELYPDNPALGSPYNTGSETFGFDSNYKRVTSLSTCFFPLCSWAAPILISLLAIFSWRSQL
jgi:acetylcholinesterase